MKSNPFRNAILCLAILLLPAAARTANASSHFTGPGASFEGINPDGMSTLSITLGANGKFTGKWNVAYLKAYSFSGTLDAAGVFTGNFGHTALTYQIAVTGSTPSTYLLTGSADGKVTTAYPAVYSKTQPAPSAIKYTALFTGTNSGSSFPQGSSYATVSISKTGAGRVTGKLADGTSFSSSGILVAGTNGQELIVFDPNVYGKKGLVSGVLLFATEFLGALEDTAGPQPDVAYEPGSVYGNLLWEKISAEGPYYAAGFRTNLNAQGYLYNKASGVTFTSGTLALDDASYSAPILQTFTATTAGVVTFTGTNSHNIKLSIKTATGAVSGSFEPVAGAEPTVKFKGLLIQYPVGALVSGYFLSPVVDGVGLSGYVTFPTTPAY